MNLLRENRKKINRNLQKKVHSIARLVFVFIFVFGTFAHFIPNTIHANGTFDFSGTFGPDDSGGTGFRTIGDKFVVSNEVDRYETLIFHTSEVPLAEETIIIKAENGVVCKTFTFKDLGISNEGGANLLEIEVVLKGYNGNEIATLSNYGTPSTLQYSGEGVTQLSTFLNHGNEYNYENVASVNITFRFTKAPNNNNDQMLWPNNLNIENITIADVSNTVNTAPTAKNVLITGTPEVGSVLTGNYDYDDEEDDQEGTSTFKWYRSDDADGANKTQISGATSNQYTLTSDDKDKYISFEVTPIASAGTPTGTPVESPRVGPIANPNIAPRATGVSVSGTLEVGNVLTGNYTYDDEHDAEGASTFKWYRSNDEFGAGKTAIAEATSKTYTLTSADRGKYISFEVTPIAIAGVTTGSPVESILKGPIIQPNRAPVLNDITPSLPETDEDTESSEIEVSSFLNSSDQDDGALKGIAVTGVTGIGQWYYFDTIWKQISSVSDSSALLLKDTDKIKYIPDSKNGETASLTFRAWDQTSGSAYALVDVSINGGSTAFSTDVGTASLTVTNVNDAPELTSSVYTFSSITKNATSARETVNSIATMTDVDNGALSGIAIYATTGSGTWEYSLNGTTWSAFGTVSDSQSLLLPSTAEVRYKSINQGETASFSFRGWDQSAGTQGSKVDTTTNGGTTPFSNNMQTASIVVQKSNEANILTFSIPGQLKPATIGAGTIYVEVAGNQDVSNLKPTFTVSDHIQSVKVGTTDQVSGETENNYSNQVTYVVTAEDETTKNWVVTVNHVPKDILLTNHTIDEKLPAGSPVGILSGIDQDSGDVLSYTIQSGDTAVFEIDNNVLKTKAVLDYNTKKQYDLTIRVTDQHEAYFDKAFTIDVLDKTPPTATVTMSSSNANAPTKAKVGDTITLDIVANEDIDAPTVTIAEKTATVTKKTDAKTWQATYEMQTGDTEGSISFTLDFRDVNGNQATQVTTVTSGTAVTFDKTAPTATVTIKSNHADSKKAKIGDTITLMITTDEDVQQPDVTIAGNAATVTKKADAKTWEATYIMASGDGDGNVAFTINFKDIVGNDAVEVTATTNTSSVTFDGTKPTATSVTMSSNNANNTIAKVGDTITLPFQTSEDIQTPDVTIAGKAATVTGNAQTWEATYVMQSGDPEGLVAFAIDFKDIVGNDGTQVTAVTTGSAVIFDENPPTVTTVMMSSNNANDQTKAKVGDTITLDIVTNEEIEVPTVTIAGTAAIVTKQTDAKTWQATYEIQTGDTEGFIPFTLDFNDLVGNSGTQVTTVTTGTAVTLDKTAPTASTVAIKSNHADSTIAKIGDTVTLTMTTDEDVQQPDVTIAGNAATVTKQTDGKTWEATYVMASGDGDGTVAFTINFKDIVGNDAAEVKATTDTSSVTFDGTKPTATSVTMSSNNANNTIAKVGDTITLPFQTSENIQTPVVTIAGKAATVTQKGNAQTWEATYDMQSGDPEGPVAFTIDFKDIVGNDGTQVTAVTTGTAVVFNEKSPIAPPPIALPPTATSVTMRSNNAHDATKAKVGDRITLEIVTNEEIEAPTVTIAGKAATVTQKTDAKTWQATYEIHASDTEGFIPFTLDFNDLVGNSGAQVTTVTTGTAVTLDKTAPTVANVTITSSSPNKKNAKVGDVITLSFSTSEDVQTPNVTIAGRAATVTKNGGAKTWKAEYTIKSGDPKGTVSFTIDMKDIVGNASTQVNATTDNSSVKVLSNNAKLSKLNVSKGSLEPAFDPTKTNYTVQVGNEVSEIDITPTVEDAAATVKLNNNNTTTKVPLTVGSNTISIVVTAEDGETKTYTVTVTRATDSTGEGGESGEGDGGSEAPAPTPTPTPTTPPKTEEIPVNVESGNNGSTVSQTIINRTNDNGKIKDEVVLTEKSVKETNKKLKEQKDNTARIVIPDTKDEVREVYISIPKTALNELKQENTNLEIQTANAKITILNSTLSKFNDDIYFRVVAIKDKTEQEQVKERVEKEEMVQSIVDGRDVEVIGRPAEIETNMQSQPVIIALPLNEEDLPNNPEARQNHLKNLVIFVEHSDGTKEILRGKIVTNKDGSLEVEFGINKFSTFTMVYMEGADEYFAELEKQTHHSYISGYPDGTFKPEQNLTRAEMATLLSRILPAQASETAMYYTDLDTDHWAYESIQTIAQSGLMEGYSNGEFKPNQTITRAEMASIVYKWKNLQGNGSKSFKDTTNHWAADVVSALTDAGIMSGYVDETFKPNQSLTRAEAVTVINKVLGRGPLTGVTTQRWPDVPASHWANEAIQEASMDHRFEMKDGKEVYKAN